MSAPTYAEIRKPRARWLLAGFLAVVLLVGGAIGFLTAPGAWFESLVKPPFNPPNWVFGPVWTTLYVLIAIAGWRTFLAEPVSLRMRVWYTQMVLNWVWSPVFFTLHLLWPAAVIVFVIWLAIIAFIVLSWQADDRPSAWLFVPYLAWISFATLLNVSLAVLN